MKTIKKFLGLCCKLLIALGFMLGDQATVTADEREPTNSPGLYIKALELYKTLVEQVELISPVIWIIIGIGTITLGYAIFRNYILLFKVNSASEHQERNDVYPPLELLKNQKYFDADPPSKSPAESKYNKTKEIREAEIALYDLWFDRYFWGDPSDMKAIGHNDGGIELSPIEKIFYVNFMKHEIQRVPKVDGGPFVFTRLRCQQFINSKTGEKLEREYLPEKYHILDFLIEYWFSNPTYELAVQIAVELDGHEFHEKTKEQAKRDKEKDRVLQTHGYLVARFTGAEVYKDPMEVIEKIDGMANTWVLNIKKTNRKVM